MIVNYTQQGWEIILQRSHGLLAAQICGHWRKDRQPKRWVETLIAAAEHDDMSNELNFPDLIHKNGGPKNFKMSDFEPGRCEALIELALGKGRFIGLLISRHIQFLYAKDPAAKLYIKKLIKREITWLQEAQTTLDEISGSYELLEFCDAFSLLICQHLIQPENRKMEISTGPDGKKYDLSLSDHGNLIVTPWPFEANIFEVIYETRHIEQLTFQSSNEFKNILNAAVVEMKTVRISKT